MGKQEGSQAKADDLSGRAQADRGGAESKMGEGEEGSMISMSKGSVRNKDGGHCWPMLWG
jgi:hypothetical protein